ncbi:T9SS type A sorting domain-containing protein [Pedobacter xixiisoli]|uniref:Por secretion system C-terminal sorting domain-containing protein n=1 Tax=Pedobacter xixiisoli TaxID=1476464 RepID=A0A286A7R9_9SPHI|nr:T9SS type A sorting domain-containing protein [Pedobacter xixiisoli]SOD17945.1 Por secretion system C-terminal sorting domain-containing protein [Pedobacter xixiisoli]
MAVSLMFKRGFFVLFFFLISLSSYGQNITNYVFAANGGTYADISGTQVFAGGADDVVSSSISIGFDFWYMGQRYTNVRISTNGWISLSNTADSAPDNNLSSGGVRPILAPLWDDLAVFPGALGTGLGAGNISHNISVVMGVKVFTVQWNLMRWDRSSALIDFLGVVTPTSVISFQAKLYENGNVQFMYRQQGGNVSAAASASVGITGTSGVFLSLNGTGTNPAADHLVEVSNISTKPASGQTYTFNPTELSAPTSLTFTRVGSTGMRLNWSDSFADEAGFVIYRSVDGGNTYTHLATTSPNATFYDDAGLTNATTYYYRLYTLRENLSVGYVSGNQLTGCQSFVVGASPNLSGAGNNGPVCAAASLILSANFIDGASYSWSGPNGFTSTQQNPVISYSDNAKGVYTVTISRNGCSAVLTTTVTSTGVGRWTGNVSADWSNPNNWCNGVLPTNAVNVSIPTLEVYNNPTLTSSGSANNLDIASGRTLTVSGAGNLQVAGAISSAGTIATSSGKVTFNGASAQTIPSNVFSTNAIMDLELNNVAGVTLNGALRLTGVLTVTAGAFNTGNFLTLASSQASTAQVASIPSAAKIEGRVTVERYVQGGTVNPYRTYRMLSSPVYDNTTTFVNTDVEGNRSAKFAQLIDDIIVSGSGGAANGFDPTHNNNSSSWYYDSGYMRVTNINTTVNAGRGMYMLYRGNRNNIALKTYPPYPDAETVVMDFEGVLNQQDVSATLTYSAANNFNLLGNPYAATIDWSSSNWGADKGTASNAIWIWNPVARGYATYINDVSTMGGTRYISSGQAFFVQTSAAGTLKFKENVKAVTQQPTILSMSVPNRSQESVPTQLATPKNLVRINMKPVNSYGEDETVIVFDQNSSVSYTEEDASHFDGEVVNISTLADAQKLAINFLPLSTNAMEIGLNVSAAASGNYVMQFNLDEYHQGYLLKLKDNYLQKTTPITLGGAHHFSIDITNAQTLGAGRFSLLVEPPTVLPVGLLSFTWKKQNEGVMLNWLIANNSSAKVFKLYRAGDDGKYVLLGDILAKEVGAYSFLDAVPLMGRNYYKLVQIDGNGNETPTEPVVVNFVLGENNVATAFPNPMKDKLTVQVNNLKDDKYQLVLYNVTGQKLISQQVSKSDLNRGYELDVLVLTPGFYFIKVSEFSSNSFVALLKVVKH